MLWYTTSLYLIWAVLIAFLVVWGAWLTRRLLKKSVRVREGAIILVTLAALLAVQAYFDGSFRWLFFRREHVDSERLGGSVYHLAFGLDENYFWRYHIYRCDKWGWNCSHIDQSEPVTQYNSVPVFGYSPWRNTSWKNAAIVLDSDTRVLYIREGEEVVYEYHLSP